MGLNIIQQNNILNDINIRVLNGIMADGFGNQQVNKVYKRGCAIEKILFLVDQYKDTFFLNVFCIQKEMIHAG